jgi:predicted nuclease of predicted toxin-antitoxin system
VKVLLDSCVWGGAQSTISAAGYDVVWVGDWQKDPGDTDILAHAYREGRVLITLDKDFGELAIMHGQRHSGLIRLVNYAARQQAAIAVHVLEVYAAELSKGAIITAEAGRLRIRPAEPPPSP